MTITPAQKAIADLIDLAERGEIDPWDVPVISIIDRFLTELGLIDEILPEPASGAHSEPLEAAATLKQALWNNLEELSSLTPQQRQELRYQKFRQIGIFQNS